MGSGFSFQELIIVLLIGLIVLGPERLPRVANQLGSWLGKARRMTRVMKRQLEDELNFEKEFDILPPDRTRHTPGSYQPPPASSSTPDVATGEDEKDDSYSPAHAADDVGTGVGDDDVNDAPPPATDDEAVSADNNDDPATDKTQTP